MLWSTFARRYMFSPKSHSVINIIAFVSLIAVAVPTAAMIILLGMFAGLSGTIEELSAASDADIEIVATRGSTLSDDSIATEDIASIEGVEHVATYVEQSVIATAAGRRIPIMLRGVDSAYFDVIPVAQYLQYGRLESVAAGDAIRLPQKLRLCATENSPVVVFKAWYFTFLSKEVTEVGIPGPVWWFCGRLVSWLHNPLHTSAAPICLWKRCLLPLPYSQQCKGKC